MQKVKIDIRSQPPSADQKPCHLEAAHHLRRHPQHGGVHDQREEAERQDVEGQREQQDHGTDDGVQDADRDRGEEQREDAVDLDAVHDQARADRGAGR